jgi:hypothetical protein
MRGGSANGGEAKAPAAAPIRGPWTVEPERAESRSKRVGSIQELHAGLIWYRKEWVNPYPDVKERD